jgi:hypothetical protein
MLYPWQSIIHPLKNLLNVDREFTEGESGDADPGADKKYQKEPGSFFFQSFHLC